MNRATKSGILPLMRKANIEESQLSQDKLEYDRFLLLESSVYSDINACYRLILKLYILCHHSGYLNSRSTQERHTSITLPIVDKLWNIVIKTVKETLKATTQMRTRHAVHYVSRRYRTNIFELFSKRRLNYLCHENFVRVHLMRSKADAGKTFWRFTEGVKVPN